MTRTIVRIPTPLRGFTAGASEVAVQGTTVREALAALESAHRGTTARVLDERGELRSFVNVFVDQKNVRSLSGLDTPVSEGAVLSILPAVAGGVSPSGGREAHPPAKSSQWLDFEGPPRGGASPPLAEVFFLCLPVHP